MNNLRRYGRIIWPAVYCAVIWGGVAAGHDCSDQSDCGVIPPNVDVATGIGAAGAGGVIGWSILKRRDRKPKTPCEELRKAVEEGAGRVKDLEAKVAAAQAEFERATKAAEQNPDFNKDFPPGGPRWIA